MPTGRPHDPVLIVADQVIPLGYYLKNLRLQLLLQRNLPPRDRDAADAARGKSAG